MLIEQLEKTNPDIAEFIKKKDKRVWLRFLGLTGFFLAFYFLVVMEYVLASKGLFWAIAVVPFLPVAAFIMTGCISLFDPAFEGMVTKVVFSVRLDAQNNARGSVGRSGRVGSVMSVRQVNYTKFFITDRYGKKYRYAVQLPNNRIDLGIVVGDTVRKYHGLPYPILLKNPASICPVCGSVNHKNDPCCYDCGFSILKDV